MKYLIILCLFLASCGESAQEKKEKIVDKIQLYEDSIIQVKSKQHELMGMNDRTPVTLDNVEKLNDKREAMFFKNQKEIVELSFKITMYRIEISALESELRKY